MINKLRRIQVTKEGFEKLEEELKKLIADRPNAVKVLSEARAMGDLSENGLYTAAKARLRSLDSRIYRLQMEIKLADIRVGGGDKISVGSKVTLRNEDREITYTIVGDFEANPIEKKISKNSPIGKELLNKKVGEVIKVKAPKGDIVYNIIKVI